MKTARRCVGSSVSFCSRSARPAKRSASSFRDTWEQYEPVASLAVWARLGVSLCAPNRSTKEQSSRELSRCRAGASGFQKKAAVQNLEFVLQQMHTALMALTSCEADDMVANSRKNMAKTAETISYDDRRKNTKLAANDRFS